MSHETKLLETIETRIYTIRGQKVILDSDLAGLCGVETKQLNRQVKRNVSRFPVDFMFQLTSDEFKLLKCQIGTSKEGRGGKHKLPYVFTENGVAMLSSVLNSEQAITVNIAIMRIFTKLRSFLLLEKNLSERIDKLEQGTNYLFKVVFERLDRIDDQLEPHLPEFRRKIGLTGK